MAALISRVGGLAPPAVSLLYEDRGSLIDELGEGGTFKQLQVLEPALRATALAELVSLVDAAVAPGGGGAAALHPLAGTIVRLANEAPFEDVRIACAALVRVLNGVTDLRVPPPAESPSSFVQRESVVPVSTTDPDVAPLLTRAFVATGRVSHLEQVPNFLQLGGDRSWLRGVAFASPMMRSIGELNALLAHRPWGLRAEHITALVREHSWSVTELVHAVVVLCSFHAMASLASAAGVVPEVDGGGACAPVSVAVASSPGLRKRVDSSEVLAKVAAADDALQAMLERHLGGDDAEPVPSGPDSFVVEGKALGVDDEALASGVDAAATPGSLNLSQFCDVVRVYENWDSKDGVMRMQEYSWEDEGFSLVSRYYPSIAPLLDEQFTLTYNLTYNTFKETADVDTEKFRRAIWYYVLRLFGIVNDDYSYAEIKQFVFAMKIKTFVRNVACFPERIAAAEFRDFSTMRPDEKLHIAMLAAEARKQAALLYGLRAVMNHMR